MEKTRKLIRQNRLQKYARILSRRYSLNVYLNNLGGTKGYTDSTSKIYINASVDQNDFKNLVLQKALVLHEIGHVLYTNNKTWLRHSIDKSIINIIEDGRVEERISREYIKARLYFIYLNQNLLKFDKEGFEEAYLKQPERCVMDAMLREAKMRTGVPQIPTKYQDILKKQIGKDNYRYLMNCIRKAVATEDEDELYNLANDIDTKMNKLFPKQNHWRDRDNVSKTSKESLDKCGRTSLKQKEQSEADEDLVDQLGEELKKQAEKLAEEISEEIDEDIASGNIPMDSSSEGEVKERDNEVEEITTTTEAEGETGEEIEEEVEGETSESGESEESEDGKLDISQSGEETGEGGSEDGEKPEGTDIDLEQLEESGILDSVNEQLENESLNDIRQESNIMQSKEAEADFSDYGEVKSLWNVFNKGGPISPKNLDPIAKKIAHLFKAIATTGDGWQHNQTRGRLEMHKITALMSGNSRPRVFKRNDKVKEVDLSACILVDASGSMGSEYRYVKAVIASYTITKALELGNYKSEVLNFYGGNNIHGIKSFNQKTSYAMGEFVPFYEGGTPLLRCLNGAEKSLAKQSSKRKIIIVITDGAPNNTGSCQRKIRELEAKGIMVIGILIGRHDYYNVFNQKHRLICNDLNKLPMQMTEVIKKVLMSIKRT